MTRRRVVGVVMGALGLVAMLSLASADVRFYLRGAYDESRILLKRRSLDRLIADSSTTLERRALLAVVRDARQFARDSLGLNVGGRFAAFSDVGRDTLVLVLSASPRDALAEYLWHYPIVGAVPYKGFFDFAAASREARALEAQGYDTYMRPAPAFSTLGWFDDPLVSTALTRDRVSLVAMVLHELTHSTWYVPNQTSFDESLANFAGWRGAECFFRARGDTAATRRAARIWQEERREGDVYAALSRRLDSLYDRHEKSPAAQSGRDSAFAWARAALSLPSGATLNNATVIAQRIYLDRLGLFDDALAAAGGSVTGTLHAIGAAVRSEEARRDPYGALTGLTPFVQGGCTIPVSPLHSSP